MNCLGSLYPIQEKKYSDRAKRDYEQKRLTSSAQSR